MGQLIAKESVIYRTTSPLQPAERTSHVQYLRVKIKTLIISFSLIVLAAFLVIAHQPFTERTSAAAGDLACTHNQWTPIPDWIGGGNALGNGYYCGPEGSAEDHAYCASKGIYNDGDGGGKWLPGPALAAGTIAGFDGHYPNFKVVTGAKLLADYDSSKDILRYEFSGHAGVESSWARVMRWTNDYASALPEISPEVVMKYMLMRLKRDSQTTGADMSKVGWDLSSIDASTYPGDGQALLDRMKSESQSCTPGTNVSPTSTQPVSCDEHLIVPSASFSVNLPSFTSNSCSAASEIDPNTGHRVAEELFRCGDYWVSAWCGATSEQQRQDIVYACRGWSQSGDGAPNGTNSFYRYFPNRLYTLTTSNGNTPGGLLASNISTYGDARGRKITWNTLMQEVQSGAIAFPYGYKDVAGALNAASMAIFNKPWGSVLTQEKNNNCSITGDDATTATTTSLQANSTGISVTATPSSEPKTTPIPTISSTPTPTIVPSPTPAVTVTSTPTQAQTPTPTPTSTPTPTAMPTTTQKSSSNSITSAIVAPTSTTTITPTAENNNIATDVVLQSSLPTGTIGKLRDGRYYNPTAVVVNNTLYVFVVGDGGNTSGRTRKQDWYNLFETHTTDGVNWTPYQLLGGNLIKPAEVAIEGNTLTVFGSFYDFLDANKNYNVFSKHMTIPGVFSPFWSSRSYTPGVNPYDRKVKQMRSAVLQNSCYTFTTAKTGQLQMQTSSDTNSCLSH